MPNVPTKDDLDEITLALIPAWKKIPALGRIPTIREICDIVFVELAKIDKKWHLFPDELKVDENKFYKSVYNKVIHQQRVRADPALRNELNNEESQGRSER